MTEPIVSLKNVDVNLKSGAGLVEVLRDVTLDLDPGETVSVMGPSGSGKTTLLMVIAGLEPPTRGSVRVAGHDLHAMGEDARALFRQDAVGIVFQNFHLMPTMTALENVALPLELKGEAQAFARARAALDAVGLSARAGHYPSQLSGGEQQRVALARACVGAPRLILADEPTGNLDAATGAAVMDMLFDLAAAHRSTLVLITHDPAVGARCGRAVRLRDGRIVS